MRSASLSRFCCGLLGVAVCLLVGLGGCASEERPRGGANDDSFSSDVDTTVADDVHQGIGTIRYIDLEGGFYGLVAEDGTKYDPTPLPERVRKDGLRVRFRVRETQAMTTRMWGTPVEVLRIEPVEE